MHAVVICLLFAAPAPFTKPERRSDLARIQGEWTQKAVYQWLDGEWVVMVSEASFNVRIQGNRFIYREAVEYFSLHGKAGIDVTSDLTVQPSRGVYSVEGDVLTIVLARPGADRPTTPARGSMKIVYLRKR